MQVEGHSVPRITLNLDHPYTAGRVTQSTVLAINGLRRAMHAGMMRRRAPKVQRQVALDRLIDQGDAVVSNDNCSSKC
jgi:hypothetical protein